MPVVVCCVVAEKIADMKPRYSYRSTVRTKVQSFETLTSKIIIVTFYHAFSPHRL